MISIKEIKCKICIIGDCAVGKTSLIRKFVLDEYDDSYIATLGAKTTIKRFLFKKDSEHVVSLTLQIWDVLGQKEFDKVQTLAYQDTHAALVVCDITRRDTLTHLKQWQTKLFDVSNKIPLIILANKVDLRHKAEFKSDDLVEASNKLQASCYFTSAKTGKNVETAFLEIGRKLIFPKPYRAS